MKYPVGCVFDIPDPFLIVLDFSRLDKTAEEVSNITKSSVFQLNYYTAKYCFSAFYPEFSTIKNSKL